MQEITEKHIQESQDVVHADEEAYLNEMVAYQLHFEGYKYDLFNGKLVKVPIDVFQKNLNPSEEEQSQLMFVILYFYPQNMWKYMLFLTFMQKSWKNLSLQNLYH